MTKFLLPKLTKTTQNQRRHCTLLSLYLAVTIEDRERERKRITCERPSIQIELRGIILKEGSGARTSHGLPEVDGADGVPGDNAPAVRGDGEAADGGRVPLKAGHPLPCEINAQRTPLCYHTCWHCSPRFVSFF